MANLLLFDTSPTAAVAGPGAAVVVAASATLDDLEVVAPKRKKRKKGGVDGGDGQVYGEGLDSETLHVAGRAFCRKGTPFASIHHVVTVGVKYELARDARLRALGQAAPMAPGSLPSQEEIKSIKKSSSVTSSDFRYLPYAYLMEVISSERRMVEGWFILCDEIVGFREGMKGRAKQMAQFKRICDTVSYLPMSVTTTASILRSCRSLSDRLLILIASRLDNLVGSTYTL